MMWGNIPIFCSASTLFALEVGMNSGKFFYGAVSQVRRAVTRSGLRRAPGQAAHLRRSAAAIEPATHGLGADARGGSAASRRRRGNA